MKGNVKTREVQQDYEENIRNQLAGVKACYLPKGPRNPQETKDKFKKLRRDLKGEEKER